MLPSESAACARKRDRVIVCVLDPHRVTWPTVRPLIQAVAWGNGALAVEDRAPNGAVCSPRGVKGPSPHASKWRSRLHVPEAQHTFRRALEADLAKASAHVAQYAAGAAHSADLRLKPPKPAGSEASSCAWPPSSSRTPPKHWDVEPEP